MRPGRPPHCQGTRRWPVWCTEISGFSFVRAKHEWCCATSIVSDRRRGTGIFFCAQPEEIRSP
jgi:hypothetical protein